MSRKFSLAYLTIPGVKALDQIKIAAEAGYDYVSLRTIPMGQESEPQNILEDDPQLFKKIQAELKAREMKLLDIELVRIAEGDTKDYRRAFEKGAELGATDVLSSVWTSDKSYAIEAYGKLCAQAQEFGLTVNFEFPIVSEVKTLKETIAIQDQVGASNLKILMDMIYCYWDKVTPEIIQALNPERFGVIHLCDCPKNWEQEEIVNVVRGQREYCGQGVIDLAGLLKALPKNNCSIELPNLANIEEFGPLGHAKKCLENAKAVFAEANL